MAEQDTLTKSEEKISWQYTPADDTQSRFGPLPAGSSSPGNVPPSSGSGNVSWTAAEYLEHHHSFGWYALLLLSTAVLGTGFYFLTKEYFAAGTIIIVGIIVAIFAARKPQQVTYEISSSGLRVGQKQYSYGLFKSFALIKEGGLSSISLVPLKRFMPPVSAYLNPADEQKIVGALSDYLPYEERRADGIDRLSRRLKL